MGDDLLERDLAMREAVEKRYHLLLNIERAERERHPIYFLAMDAGKSILLRCLRIALGIALAYGAWLCWASAAELFAPPLQAWTVWSVLGMVFMAWLAIALFGIAIPAAFGPASPPDERRMDLLQQAFNDVRDQPRWPREF